MNKGSDSFWDRMKQQPLSFWGAICVFSGIFSALMMNLMVDASDMGRAEARASQLGGAFGGGLIALIGVVLIGLHFLRGRKS